MEGLSNKDRTLIQSVIDHALYLEGKAAQQFRAEVEAACAHYAINKKVNYDLSKFKFDLTEVIH